MDLKNGMRSLASRAVHFAARHGHEALRADIDVDLYLSALCRSEELGGLRFPVACLSFLRSCIEPTHCGVREVKPLDGERDSSHERFTTLLEVLRSSLPPIEVSRALATALIADSYQCMLQPVQWEGWAGDVSLHFQLCSSFGKKGRILSTIIRFAGSKRCMELGTAYGMSAVFILEALKANERGGHLLTLEGFEPLYLLASGMLKPRYGEMVSCCFGRTQDGLSELAIRAAPIDFLFHDAGHSREDFVHDFNAVKGSLAPGAVGLIDDIRWEDLKIAQGKPSRCYEGWREICADSGVRCAVEIDNSFGLLLLR